MQTMLICAGQLQSFSDEAPPQQRVHVHALEERPRALQAGWCYTLALVGTRCRLITNAPGAAGVASSPRAAATYDALVLCGEGGELSLLSVPRCVAGESAGVRCETVGQTVQPTLMAGGDSHVLLATEGGDVWHGRVEAGALQLQRVDLRSFQRELAVSVIAVACGGAHSCLVTGHGARQLRLAPRCASPADRFCVLRRRPLLGLESAQPVLAVGAATPVQSGACGSSWWPPRVRHCGGALAHGISDERW